MDHESAVRLQAPERYLLHDLLPADREDFEAHFFTCHDCAEEVLLQAVFKANAKAVFREYQKRNPARPLSSEQAP